MSELYENYANLRGRNYTSYQSDYTLGNTLRPDNSTPFPLGWLIFSIILIIMVVILLYFYYRQRSQLVEPDRVPTIRSRYAVVPGIDKEPLNSCGPGSSTGQEPCVSSAATLGKAIDYCNLNYKICSEFTYDPISQVVKITNPSGPRSSSQQGNLYLQQVGTISPT